MARPRFAPTGQRSTPQLGQLPRSVQQLGLPPGGRSLGQPLTQPRQIRRIPQPQPNPQRVQILSRAYQNEVVRQQQNEGALSDYLKVQSRAGGRIDQSTLDELSNRTEAPSPEDLMYRHGLNRTEAELLSQILVQRRAGSLQRQHDPVTSVLFKGINATTAASAALAKGVIEQDYNTSSPQMAAWSYIHGLGKGFTEIPGAVKEGYDYQALIKERTNKDSFLYRWSLPIGTGLDIALDPITYLSGGTSSVDRIAGMRSVEFADKLATTKALDGIAKGTLKNPETGLPYTVHDFDEALGRVRLKDRAPWTNGDALAIEEALGTKDWNTIEKELIKRSRPINEAGIMTQRESSRLMRQQGRAAKKAFRRGKTPEGDKARLRDIVGGYLAPTAVRGRAGIGVAGLELPGTARAGEALGQVARKGARKLYESGGVGRVYRKTADDMVPNAVLRHTTSDLGRARAIYLQARIRDTLNAAPGIQFEKSVEHLSKSNLYREVKQEKLIPGKPSTTGPETGVVFSHNGTLMGPEDLVGVKHHNIYNENNDLIGSVTWHDNNPFSPNEIEAATIYIRPEFRNLENYFKLIKPLSDEAVQSGKVVSAMFLNHQLADIMERKAAELGVPLRAHRITSSLSQREAQLAAERAAATGGRVRKRGRQVPVEVAPNNLPDLATPDIVEQIMGHQLLGTVADVAPYSVRKNTHAMAQSAMSTEQKEFRKLYDNRLNLYRKQARGAERKPHEIEDDIRKYEETNSDPLSVLAHLQVDLDMRKIVKKFRDDILSDPRFTRQIEKTRETEHGTVIYRADPPQGYDLYRRAGSGKYYHVRTEIKYALDTLDNQPFMRLLHDLNTKGPFGQVTDWWKAMATMPNPSFHTMNFVGAVWNNHLSGVYGFPGDYIKHYFQTVHPARLERAAIHGRRTIRAPLRAARRLAPESTKQTRAALERFRELESQGAFGRQSFIAETEQTLGSDVLDIAGPGGLKKLFQPGPELEMKKPGILLKTGKQRLALRRGRQALAVGGAAGLALTGVGAPLAPLALLMPDLARIGVKHFAGPIETIVRITPYLEHAGDERVLRYVRSIEDAAGPPRAPGLDPFKGYTKSQRKVASDMAGDIVKRFQFDYTDVTPFEQNFIRTVFPFYTYYRKNFVVQAQELIRQPRNIVYLNAMHNFFDEWAGDIGPMKEVLPWYFLQMDAFHMPMPGWMRKQLGIKKDQPIFINPKLPYATLNMFPPMWELINNPNPTPQTAGQIFAPIYGSIGPHTFIPGSKIMMEYISGWSFGMNRPIDFQRRSSNDYRNSSVDAPFYAKYMPSQLRDWLGIVKDPRGRYQMSASGKYILEQTAAPFMSNFGSSIPPEGATDEERGRAMANRVAWVTGYRLMPADMHRLSKNYAYGVKNLLEAKKSDAQHRGGHLSPEDEELLIMTRLYVDVAKAVDDKRYIEQYGKPPGAP